MCSLLLVYAASAARVAVVVKFPDQTQTRCVTAPQGTDAYRILEDLDFNAAWSYYGQSLGHGLCGISGTGCPSTNCYCNPNEYWNFYVKGSGGAQWTYSQVGFDGGASCNDHYCAADGDMIGLGFGTYGTEPAAYSFDEVCCSMAGDTFPCGTITLAEVVDYITTWQEGNASLGDVVDLIDAWSRG